MASAMQRFLEAADLAHEAADDAAERCAQAWAGELLDGYSTDPAEALKATFDQSQGSLVSLSSIPFVSTCSHHLLPFFGQAHVAYQPSDRLVGLGSLETLVRCLSRRLQLQEKLGEEIAQALAAELSAEGAACILEAEHLCVFARGGRQRGPVTRTTAFAGTLADDPVFRQQCLMLLGNSSPNGSNQEQDNE